MQHLLLVLSKIRTLQYQHVDIYIYTYKESVTKYLYSPILDLELKNPEAWFEKKCERARFSIRYGY